MNNAFKPKPIGTPEQASAIPPGLPTLALFGLDMVNAPGADALDWLCHRMAMGHAAHVAFFNAHCGNVAARDAAYAAALADADAILPDGAGVALAAVMAGQRIVANLNGTDLVPALCQRMGAAGQSVFLLGGKPGIAERAAATLAGCCPGLRIAGSHHGYFGPAAEADIIDQINQSGADLLLVAMGVPEQELWLHRVGPDLDVPVAMGVGALLDFLAGAVPRAPKAMRDARLEWLYRLYQEPKRLWRRYVLGNPAFLLRAARHAWFDGEPIGKRLFDVALTAPVLFLSMPLLLAIALAVKLTTPGPALLRQTRVGKNGRHFTLLKFRSMYIASDPRRNEAAALQCTARRASRSR